MDSMKDVDMNVVQDVHIVAEYPFFKSFGIKRILGYLILCIILVPFFFQIQNQNQFEKIYNISSDLNERTPISIFVNDINKFNRYLYIDLNFNNFEDLSQIDISGDFFVIGYKQNKDAFFIKQNTTNQFMNVSNITNKVPTLRAFVDNIMDYNSLVASFSFNSSKMSRQVSFTVTTGYPKSTFLLGIIRIVFLCYFSIQIIIGILQIKDVGLSLEQMLTFGMTVAVFLYIDPFEIINAYFPVKINGIRSLITNDIFSSFFMFYCLSLIFLIGHEPGQEKALLLAIPYMVGIVYLVVMFSFDGFLRCTRSLQMVYIDEVDEKLIHTSRGLLYAIFFVVFIIKTIHTITVSQNFDFTRVVHYFISIFPFLVIHLTYHCLIHFTTILDNSILIELMPLITSIAFVIVISTSHESVEFNEKIMYEKQDDNHIQGSIGAEEMNVVQSENQ